MPAGLAKEVVELMAELVGDADDMNVPEGSWFGLQMAYDLWQARERIRSLEVRHFKAT